MVLIFLSSSVALPKALAQALSSPTKPEAAKSDVVEREPTANKVVAKKALQKKQTLKL